MHAVGLNFVRVEPDTPRVWGEEAAEVGEEAAEGKYLRVGQLACVPCHNSHYNSHL